MKKISLNGFKDFLLKNNLIEVASGIVIGTAFTALVTAFTSNIIQPLINVIGGNNDSTGGLTFQILSNNPETTINVGALITGLINFLIIALVLYYFILVPYAALKKITLKEKEEEKPEVTDILEDIKLLLEKQNKTN